MKTALQRSVLLGDTDPLSTKLFFFFFFLNLNLFIWLYCVFIVACRIFSCSMQTHSCSKWDLHPGIQPGIELGSPALGAWSLRCWTTREVPAPSLKGCGNVSGDAIGWGKNQLTRTLTQNKDRIGRSSCISRMKWGRDPHSLLDYHWWASWVLTSTGFCLSELYIPISRALTPESFSLCPPHRSLPPH